MRKSLEMLLVSKAPKRVASTVGPPNLTKNDRSMEGLNRKNRMIAPAVWKIPTRASAVLTSKMRAAIGVNIVEDPKPTTAAITSVASATKINQIGRNTSLLYHKGNRDDHTKLS